MAFNKKRQLDTDSDGETPQVVKKKSRPEKPAAAPEGAKSIDESGNPYWHIGKNRRVSYTTFKGHGLVNIREYYVAPDGELRPGKKGISLSMAQFNALLQVIPQLSQELRAEGHDVGDAPQVVPSAAATATANDASSAKAEKPRKKAPKANIDATSDEEEDGDVED